ncbi:MAG: hypothetical protein V9G10_08235 [Candidatus Nanopelagicales bacterium]
MEIDGQARTLRLPDGTILHEGDVISIDGSTGEVFNGAVDVRPSPVVRVLRRRHRRRSGQRRRPFRRTRARRWTGSCATRTTPAGCSCEPTPTRLRTPRAAAAWAAEGIGLCRTEHMFLGERKQYVREDDPRRE